MLNPSPLPPSHPRLVSNQSITGFEAHSGGLCLSCLSAGRLKCLWKCVEITGACLSITFGHEAERKNIKVWQMISHQRNIIQDHKYAVYLHQTNCVVFVITSANKSAKFHLPTTVTGRLGLFVHVIYSSAGRHWHFSAPESLRLHSDQLDAFSSKSCHYSAYVSTFPGLSISHLSGC